MWRNRYGKPTKPFVDDYGIEALELLAQFQWSRKDPQYYRCCLDVELFVEEAYPCTKANPLFKQLVMGLAPTFENDS